MSQSNQQFPQLLSSLTSSIFNEAISFSRHKQQLTQIIIDETINDDEKLEKLENNILYFRANFFDNTKSQPTDNQKSLDLQAWKNIDLDFPDWAEIIDMVTLPSRIHQKLLKSIGDVFRNDESSQQKIKAIRKVLV